MNKQLAKSFARFDGVRDGEKRYTDEKQNIIMLDKRNVPFKLSNDRRTFIYRRSGGRS